MLEKKIETIKGTFCEKSATIYTDSDAKTKAVLLYFHGGGLLCGSREDLPELHLKTFTRAGYAIIAFDYPLAPAAKMDTILPDVIESIHWYLKNTDKLFSFSDREKGTENLPYFLWGRSAGAYLCLLAATNGKLATIPAGVLSYYGYGFLCDNWYQEPSAYYKALPAVPESCLSGSFDSLHCNGDFDTHYSIYVYARQTGKWKDLFYEGREKYFFLDYSLRAKEAFPCPLFCAHSTGDTDVPFQEFLSLCSRYNPKRYIASAKAHDFDRDTDNPQTKRLLEESVNFLDSHLDH